jgi:nitrate/TMAO reductase-like tetraheme cytochrome c subunit
MPVDVQNPPVGGRFAPLIYLSSNWISLVGVVIVTTAVVFWLFLLPTTLHGYAASPYIGILAFLVVPAGFFLGLVLLPVGMIVQRRKQGRAGLYPSSFPPANWRNPQFRRLAYFIGGATVVNIVIASQVSYGAVEYMDSVNFCGQTCHAVMQPEYTAYQTSPHARLECVQCHIGPGASWFVRSKLSGVGQVFAVTFNTYPQPIPTPVRNLRPARETCETCHWPQVFGQDRIEVLRHFADDEANTLTKTVLLMKIGGGNQGIGIHGTHLGPGVRILYTPTDETRQTISKVEYYGPNGQHMVYTEAPAARTKALAARAMDCMDCHNRPAHPFQLPDRAVNNAIEAGDISPDLPFAKKESVALLQAQYGTRAEAAARIPAVFAQFYREKYPAVYGQHQAEVEKAARGLLAIYDRNVFPAMRVTWATYPNDLGHMDSPGCFRCHDGGHTGAGGQTISNDCNACHNLLAVDQTNPKILTDLGIVERQPAGVITR